MCVCMDEWVIEFMASWLAGWVVSGKMCRWRIDGGWSWMGGWLAGSEDQDSWVN